MSTKAVELWSPAHGTGIWRMLALLMLTLIWYTGESSEAGFLLLLFLLVTTLARWRFSLPSWTVLIDQAACLAMTIFWSDAWFGLALPVFEALLKRGLLFTLPALFSILFYSPLSILLISAVAQAAFSGWVIRIWSHQADKYRLEADQERRDRYELEKLKEEWLTANARAARIAELTERSRISHRLHDHVGHEITAAVLAMQAFEQLWKENDPEAGALFDLAQQRLTNSAVQLRETVHDITPVKAIGVSRIEEICREFTACPVQLNVYGDTAKVPAYLWTVLEPCLKEALTNVARHSNAELVSVSLDVSAAIVRLSVQDDGSGRAGDAEGTGLRNLRQRARSVGGTVSIHAADGFRLVCVLPLGKEIV